MPNLTKAGKPSRRGSPKGRINRTAAGDKYHNFKVCTSCHREKKLADFPLAGKGRTVKAADPRRFGSHCKICRKTKSKLSPTAKRHHQAGKGKPFDAAKNRKETRKQTRIKAFEYLAEKGCCDCGIRDPRVLEFDHIDPAQKKYKMSRLIASGYSWGSPILRKEIRKCRVICANCHRAHTKQQQNYYSDPVVAEVLSRILKRHGYTE